MEKYKQIVLCSARVILAGVFAYAAVSKILRPDEFYIAVMNYQILPKYLAYAVAYFLPALELVCAVALLSKAVCKASAYIICLMLSAFIAAVLLSWLRGLNISCGCFGGEDSTGGYLGIIVRDIVLLGLCVIIFLINPNRNLI